MVTWFLPCLKSTQGLRKTNKLARNCSKAAVTKGRARSPLLSFSGLPAHNTFPPCSLLSGRCSGKDPREGGSNTWGSLWDTRAQAVSTAGLGLAASTIAAHCCHLSPAAPQSALNPIPLRPLGEGKRITAGTEALDERVFGLEDLLTEHYRSTEFPDLGSQVTKNNLLR